MNNLPVSSETNRNATHLMVPASERLVLPVCFSSPVFYGTKYPITGRADELQLLKIIIS